MPKPALSALATFAATLALAASTTGCMLFETTYDDGGAEGGPIEPDFCPDSWEQTRGELGLIGFQWDVGIFGCLFGCGAEEWLAVGSNAVVFIVGDEDLPPFYVESESPEIIEFEADESSDVITVTAHAEGTARVLVKDLATDELLDAGEFTAHEVAELRYQFPEYVDTLTIMRGGWISVGVGLEDEDGCGLIGVGSVEYELSGGTISEDEVTLLDALARWFENLLVGSIDEYVEIETHGIGTGLLTATSASGVTLEVPIEVVGPEAVTRVELTGPAGEGIVGEELSVSAHAFAADEPVHDPRCEWTLSPPDGPVQLDAGWHSADLWADEPGAAALACAIGTESASTEVRFQ